MQHEFLDTNHQYSPRRDFSTTDMDWQARVDFGRMRRERLQRTLDKIRARSKSGVSVNEGDTLLLYTGTYNHYYGKVDYLSQYPGLDESGSGWLVEKGIKIFGVDSPSPDNPISSTYPCHMMCREHGIVHYENLANLDNLVGKRFTFIGLPLRIRGGTGCSMIRNYEIREG